MLIAMVFAAASRYTRPHHARDVFPRGLANRCLQSIREGSGQALAVSVTLLVSGTVLVADSERDVVDTARITQAWRDRALEKVRATAIHLPTPAEARATQDIQRLHLEKAQLQSALAQIEARYAAFVHGLEQRMVDLELNLAQAQKELHRGKSERQSLQRTLAHVISSSPSSSEHQPFQASLVANGTLSMAPLDRSSRQTDVSAVETAARKIADALRKTRNQALWMKSEQVFTMELDKRVLRFGSHNEIIPIDPNVDVTLHTARTELLGRNSGRIRFFPNGTATGGLIQVGSQAYGKDIRVRWSDASVSVDAVED